MIPKVLLGNSHMVVIDCIIFIANIKKQLPFHLLNRREMWVTFLFKAMPKRFDIILRYYGVATLAQLARAPLS